MASGSPFQPNKTPTKPNFCAPDALQPRPSYDRKRGHPVIRIANGQGFWGDSPDAPIEQVRRGPIDYLTLDYLAEVTMSILQKQRSRDPEAGYARDFVDVVDRLLPDLLSKNVRLIANAGGLNPEACRRAVLAVAARQGVD